MRTVLLESADAAKILDLTPAGVRLLARSGRLPVAAVTSRGLRLFQAADVLALRRARAAEREQRRPRRTRRPAGPVTARQGEKRSANGAEHSTGCLEASPSGTGVGRTRPRWGGLAVVEASQFVDRPARRH